MMTPALWIINILCTEVPNYYKTKLDMFYLSTQCVLYTFVCTFCTTVTFDISQVSENISTAILMGRELELGKGGRILRKKSVT